MFLRDMQEDSIFPAAERIISDISAAFKKEPKLKEFDIVPVTLNENKSPVLIENDCLGLESWCVKHVYCHAYSRVMEARLHKRRKQEEGDRLDGLLRVALLINPDVSSMWNMRRELVVTSQLDICAELHFSKVVLSRKPKSGEVFAYRRWLIKLLLSHKVEVEDSVSNNWTALCDELAVSEMAADRYANNYHAWNHRMWCLKQLLSLPHTSSHVTTTDLLRSEWSRSRDWVATHVSDHSGFQYRQHLLARMLDDHALLRQESHDKSLRLFLSQAGVTDTMTSLNDRCRAAVALLCAELAFNGELLELFPGHEAIWCHRRFLLHAFHSRALLVDNNRERFDRFAPHRTTADGAPLEKELRRDGEGEGPEWLRTALVGGERGLCARLIGDVKAASRHRLFIENVLKIALN